MVLKINACHIGMGYTALGLTPASGPLRVQIKDGSIAGGWSHTQVWGEVRALG